MSTSVICSWTKGYSKRKIGSDASEKLHISTSGAIADYHLQGQLWAPNAAPPLPPPRPL